MAEKWGDTVRVLFDGFWWANGPAANRTVQREFIFAWRRAFPTDELIIAARNKELAAVPADFAGVGTRLWPQAVSNAIELPRLAKKYRADLIVSHNYAPLAGQSIVFVHDAMFRDHPEWFSRFERLYFSYMLPSARRAKAVATSTATEAARIERLAPHLVPVAVTGLAVPPALTDAIPTRPAGIGDVTEFALTVGRLNVRKNLERLISGASGSAHITPQTPLLIVGSSEHSGVASTLPAKIEALRAQGRVRFLGRIDDAELAWLYQNTSLALSLTRDEGCGMTPLEAVHFGAPLLVSDIPVHHETVGGYASFVSPDATETEIAAAVDAAWAVKPSANKQAKIANRWSWEDAARTLRALVGIVR